MMKITVCIGSSCHLKGSRQIVEEFKKMIEEHKLQNVELSGTFCMDNCMCGVCVDIDGTHYSVNPQNARDFFQQNVLEK